MLLRSTALVGLLAVIVAACGSGNGAGGDPASSVTTSTPPTTSTSTTGGSVPVGLGPPGTLPAGPSALDDMYHPDFPDPLIDVAGILSGGPPPDGIPAIDQPEFVPIATADAYLQPDEPVVVLDLGGEAKAYPVQILIWHEIVNDTVGGIPVAITYCPLCNSAVSYLRVVNEVETTFGTSGRLFNSALVMYDRDTESLWTHYDGRAVVGVLAGAEVEAIPSPLMAWADFKDAYSDGVVLDRERTGHARNYGSNPYVGYDDPGGTPFLFRGDADSRARELQRVIGIEVDGEAVAYSLDVIAAGEASATPVDVASRSLVLLWKSGQSSALAGPETANAKDVGTVGVFVAEAEGAALTISVQDGAFVDAETTSVWNIAGQAIAGPLEGAQLERVVHLDTFWFAWSTYRPGTALVDQPVG